MNKKQAAALSTLAYLDRPDDKDNDNDEVVVTTLEELVKYYLYRPEKLPKDEDKREEVLAAIEIVQSDPYLQKLQIIDYTNNNNTGTKSGFVGYAFAETTSSKDGVVSFRGSETPIMENLNDWFNNVSMETGPTSKQMEDAIDFMNHIDEVDKTGAGNFTSIETVGHSLGGFHAATQAILDPRVTSATTFNAPGVPNSFIRENIIQILKNKNKIDSYSASGDLVSKIGSPLDFPAVASGSFNIVDAHNMENFLEGDENMKNTGFTEILQELTSGLSASLIDCIAMPIDAICPGLVENITTYFSELPGNVSGFFDQITTGLSTWNSDMIIKSEEEMPNFIESVKTYFSELPGNVGGFFDQITTGLSTWNSDMIIKSEEEIPSFIESVNTPFSELPGNVGGFFDQITNGLSTWTSDMMIKSEEEMPNFISQITTFFSQLPGNMLPIGGDMVKGIFDGISNSIGWLREKLSGWADNVVDYIKGLFDINSPSKVMRDTVGVGIAEGVAVGILENTDLVTDAMSEMADAVTDSDLVVEPEVAAKSLDFEAFKEKIRPSLDLIKAQLSQAQDIMTARFCASAQLVAAKTCATMDSVYNKTTNFNNNYNITAANSSPKATADAIKNQMTMQRMLFATR